MRVGEALAQVHRDGGHGEVAALVLHLVRVRVRVLVRVRVRVRVRVWVRVRVIACTRGGLDQAGTSCLGLSLERRPTSGFGGGAAWFANQLPPPLRAWAAARGEAAGAAAEGSGPKPNASMACA